MGWSWLTSCEEEGVLLESLCCDLQSPGWEGTAQHAPVTWVDQVMMGLPAVQHLQLSSPLTTSLPSLLDWLLAIYTFMSIFLIILSIVLEVGHTMSTTRYKPTIQANSFRSRIYITWETEYLE